MMPARARKDETDNVVADVSAPDADAVTEPAESKDDAPAESKKDDDKGASSGTEYLNTTASVLVYDREGHSVGGHEWTPAVHLDAIGKAARSNGYLLPRSAL